jgi:hypothetical protein
MDSVIELKNEAFPNGANRVRIWIDGVQFGKALIDVKALQKSAITPGEYDIQTCGCGEPGCAGFWEPIVVKHDGEVIAWEFDIRFHPIPPVSEEEEDAMEPCFVRYQFNRAQYLSEVRKLADQENPLRRTPDNETV